MGKVIYVDADATGMNNGSTWADAYKYLQDALGDARTAEKPVEIRVGGDHYRSYRPGATGDREATFQLINGVTLKGGYAGLREPDPNARDIELYPTILSGDLNGDDGPGSFTDIDENSYHVVTARWTDTTAVLDGFIVRAGNADGQHADDTNKGGGMYNDRSTATIINCIFTENFADRGAGMYNDDSNPTLINCKFSYNWARIVGGGMHNYEGGSESATVLVDCVFQRNVSQSGGGMCNDADDGVCNVTLTNCMFDDNDADGTGGGMDNDADEGVCNLILTNCTFDDNSAGLFGGGMCNDSSDGVCNAEIIDCTFSGNSASKGGGISDSNSTLTNCTFTDNYASEEGGGLCFGQDSPTLTNCTFNGNSAKILGGAIYNRCGAPVIENCTFAGNSAPGGGAIYNWMYLCDGIVTVTGCRFIGNSATGLVPSWGEGGAMYNYCGNQTLTNCLFSENSATDTGSGLFNIWCATTMINCTLSGSKSDSAAGMFIDEAHTHATNCIFRDVDGGIADYDGFETITFCNVSGGWPGEGNIDADPCFADPGYWDANGTPEDANDDFWVDGDYHLKSQAGRRDPNEGRWTIDEVTSPCIDAGDPMSPIGLESFPNGGIVNMGAYGGTVEASKSYFGGPPCETIVAGDINGDCVVNFLDFQLMGLHWCEDNGP
ncbi:MAG: right-handed parallel beta-helix repeat-containing protein [Planctomycetota bacterium]